MLKELLIKKGFEKGNNCYFKTTRDKVYYFNMDDNEEFTTVTVEHTRCGGQEKVLYEEVTEELIEALRN